MTAEGARNHDFLEHFADGQASRVTSRALAVEAPVAIEINGVGYAVMMATPTDLADYALGFCLSEQLIDAPAEFVSARASEVAAGGWMLRIELAGAGAGALLERARLRLAEGSCGLCGIESLEQVLRPLEPLGPHAETDNSKTDSRKIGKEAVFRALEALSAHQPLGSLTRAAHAAAFCAPDGEILLTREDVGRHNAFDKLIGALAHAGISPAAGFVLLTARCSFELVQKAIIARVPMLATISAASTLAVEQARAHGLRLLTLARADSILEG